MIYICIISIFVVFLALILLWLFFSITASFFIKSQNRGFRQMLTSTIIKKSTTHKEDKAQDFDPEIALVIALALEKYRNRKELVLTIKPQVSNWASPGFNFRK